jgi:mannose-6-phosphate isomerase class I
MEQLVQTFKHCCAALQSGMNVIEANGWLISLTENKDVCFPLCITMINIADVTTADTVFLAAKIVHNMLRESRYTISVNSECLEVSF